MALNRRAGCAKTEVLRRKPPVFALKMPKNIFRAGALKKNRFLGLAQIKQKNAEIPPLWVLAGASGRLPTFQQRHHGIGGFIVQLTKTLSEWN